MLSQAEAAAALDDVEAAAALDDDDDDECMAELLDSDVLLSDNEEQVQNDAGQDSPLVLQRRKPRRVAAAPAHEHGHGAGASDCSDEENCSDEEMEDADAPAK